MTRMKLNTDLFGNYPAHSLLALPMRNATIQATLLSTIACSGLVDVERQNTRPLDPLPVYATWWDEISTCAGRSEDMGRIAWWQATSIMVNKRIVRGQWERPHRITLVSSYVETENVVKHEMLHDLLDGDPKHDNDRWDACGVRTP